MERDDPFRIDFAGSGSEVSGSFFNGKEKITSTDGQFQNGTLVLNLAAYAAQLKATLKDGICPIFYLSRPG
jgi:hypothetical protein